MITSVPRARFIVLGLTLALLTTAGCSGLTSVQGVVNYKGAPVDGAMVMYVNDDGTTAGQGQSDGSGKYKLVTPQGKEGVPAGTYTVTVTKTSRVGGSEAINPGDPASMAKMKDMMMKGMKAAESLLPNKFSTKATSTLKKTVPSKDYNLDLDS
jgi:hypothetical protein